jgi:hypothetical protein
MSFRRRQETGTPFFHQLRLAPTYECWMWPRFWVRHVVPNHYPEESDRQSMLGKAGLRELRHLRAFLSSQVFRCRQYRGGAPQLETVHLTALLSVHPRSLQLKGRSRLDCAPLVRAGHPMNPQKEDHYQHDHADTCSDCPNHTALECRGGIHQSLELS